MSDSPWLQSGLFALGFFLSGFSASWLLGVRSVRFLIALTPVSAVIISSVSFLLAELFSISFQNFWMILVVATLAAATVSGIKYARFQLVLTGHLLTVLTMTLFLSLVSLPQRMGEDAVEILLTAAWRVDDLSGSLDARRGLTLPLLYSLPGKSLVLGSMGPLFMVYFLASVFLLTRHFLRGKTGDLLANLAGGGALLVLLATPITQTMSTYVGPHTIAAISVTVACAALLDAAKAQKLEREQFFALSAGIASASLTRLEGFVMLELAVILAYLNLAERDTRQSRRWLAALAPGAIAFTLLLSTHEGNLAGLSPFVFLLCLLPCAVILLNPSPALSLGLLIALYLALPLGILGAALYLHPASIEVSLLTLFANLFLGVGGWGVTLAILLLALLARIPVDRFSGQKHLNQHLFVQVQFLILAKLTDGPTTSLGFNDSVSRMMFHLSGLIVMEIALTLVVLWNPSSGGTKVIRRGQ